MCAGLRASVEFRRYEPRDAEAVWSLHNAALQAISAHAGDGPWDDDLANVAEVYLESGGEFLVGLLGSEVVAMGALRPISATVAEIKRMRVAPALQGRGLGRQILTLLEAVASERGFERLELDTSGAMVAALGLYTAFGYREFKRASLGPLEMVFMEKRLRDFASAARAGSDRVVFWDFDGTLAQRPGLWSSCVMEVLDGFEPGHGITRDQIRVGLIDGFPWHRPDVPHTGLADADAWWAAISPTIVGALVAAGVSRPRADELVPLVRQRYVDPTIGWELFDDTLPALTAAAAAGWRNVILSNHVPELPALVEGIGLGAVIEQSFSSATTGYEKPHPEAFRHALRVCGSPSIAFMVGDNPVADIQGAQAVGLPAVLVRTNGDARYRTDGLAGAVQLILAFA